MEREWPAAMSSSGAGVMSELQADERDERAVPLVQRVAPSGFKARRKQGKLSWLAERSRLAQVQRQEEADIFSDVDPELLQNTNYSKLLAGVARLVFLHIEQRRSRSLFQNWWRSREAHRYVEADFNDANFFSRPCRLLRCCPSFCRGANTSDVNPDVIFDFLHAVFVSGRFPKDLIPIASIYIEKFIFSGKLALTHRNWRSVCTAAFILATKVWEDIHPYNVDFAELLRTNCNLRVQTRSSLYDLESKFMNVMRWRVHIRSELYAAYFFALRDADTPRFDLATDGGSEFRRDLEVYAPHPALSSQSSCSPTSTSMTLTLSTSCGSLSSRTLSSGNCTPFKREVSAGDEEFNVYMQTQSWRLNPRNPYIGTFRHAQTASPPSRFIRHRRWTEEDLHVSKMRVQGCDGSSRHPLLVHSLGPHSKSAGNLLLVHEATR
mmetsp:Transcript_21747/g.50823  ORF Transcript_21747/g.50823 Transcript_21747/m.50823 type:complete len:436 (+) Transcript_21747:47-1354(+)